jgi:6-pyruvoyltetrahydropterin/6-carboxytetrahydropterin synthase
MADAPRFRMTLAKEDFKFSVAHFTLFEDRPAELLHGHNYRVRVEISGTGLDGEGLLVDLERVKREIRRLCRGLDSRTLIPAESPRLAWERRDGGVEVRFEGRFYRIPEEDVLLLPLANTSIELLARLLWRGLAAELAGTRAETLAVAVEESAGQSCGYEAPLARG